MANGEHHISEMPTLISWLEEAKPKDVIAAMRSLAAVGLTLLHPG
jgi:hypothetical protein